VRVLDTRRDVLIDLYLDFRKDLRAALASQELAVVRDFLRSAGRQLGDVDLMRIAGWEDERLQALIARMTLADPRLVAHHRQARQYLSRRGVVVPWGAGGYGRPNLQVEVVRRSA
jgi:hypothetical protein